MSEDEGIDRRDLLKYGAGAGIVGAAGCFGLAMLGREEDAPTKQVTGEKAQTMADRYAPVLYFDSEERWFPTDPKQYESEVDGDPVVDGFDAFDGYTSEYEEAGSPPKPTVFYRVLRYEDSSLSVVQYWLYSAFDQFSTNFHWHDWEVVHVFVDEGAESTVDGQTANPESEPQLFVASAHSRKVPNNEFLDPEAESVPRILAELGSHSSALSLNTIPDTFQRLPSGGTFADITNRALSAVEAAAEIPIAYGLPRDEGFRLPFVVPELDGDPIYEHPNLPSVGRDSLVASELTVRSFQELASPPTTLPVRETGLVFAAAAPEGTETASGPSADVDADVRYTLSPTADIEHITAFTGPQLSFEFPIPGFVEDRIANHITTTGVPWQQERYDNPAADISEPAHRATLAERYDAIAQPKPSNRVVAVVQQTASEASAPDDEGVTTQAVSVESLCLLESDPEAVPTFNGLAVLQDVDPGDHRLTVNGPGFAPYSEQVGVSESEEPTVAGVDGAVALTPSEDAVKLRVDADGTDADLTDLAVEDDFGGRLYDAPLDGPDAVYVDRRGAYTTEVRDSDGELGAFRVNPGAVDTVTVERPATGKAPLASFVADVATETATSVRTAAGLAEEDTDDGTDEDSAADEEPTGEPPGQQPTPTATPTQSEPTPTATDTEPTPTATETEPAPTATEPEPTPTATESEPTPTATRTESTSTATATATEEERRTESDETTTRTRRTRQSRRVQDGSAVRGLARALEAVADAAERAAARAEEGERGRADEALEQVTAGLERVASRLLEAQADLPEATVNAVDRRNQQVRRRANQALDAGR